MAKPPQYPAGEFSSPGDYDLAARLALIEELESAPEMIARSIEGLSDEKLNTKYRNWTIRQIVNHLADSHINCYVRYRWTLTEETPTIKAYDETQWSELADAKTMPLESSLAILSGVHCRWAHLLRSMSDVDFDRKFFHPESQSEVSLKEALPSYVWHGKHHAAQIEWVRATHGF